MAIVDLRLPDLDGMDILNAVKRDGLATRILMLSASTEGPLVFQAVSAGAAGYLSKNADRTAVCDAVAAIARGESVLDPGVQSGLFAEVRSRGVADQRPVLTQRENEILRLIAEGKSAPDISRELFLSTATVKTHLGHLYEKLGVSDRAACVAEAMRRGLLE